MRHRISVFFGLFLSLLCFNPSRLDAQTGSSWGDLKAGSYSVGFKFVYETDRSRSWQAKEDANGYPQADQRSRPIRVGIWYPAEAAATTTARMTYRDYMPSTASASPFRELNSSLFKRDADNLRSSFKGEFDGVMAAPMAAVQNARPSKGVYPLIAYSAGLNNNSQDNVILCEFLASHGFIVATVPQLGVTSLDANLTFQSPVDVETQALDLQFAVGIARGVEGADSSRFGIIGYSVGGVVALQLAMRSIDVDALVTLDPTFGVTPFIKLATQWPYYSPTGFRAPWLYMYRTEAATNLAVLNEFRFSDRHEIELKGISHQDFSSAPMLAASTPASSTRTLLSAKVGYQAVVRYIHQFLEAYLNRNQRALEWVRGNPQQNGTADAVGRFELHKGAQPPPTEAKFLQIIEQQGFDSARKLYGSIRSGRPGQPVFSENFLNQLGYRFLNQSRFQEAISTFQLNVDAYPESANVYDSLADAYSRSGNVELAIKFYEKSIELNPKNTGAIEAVKKLKGMIL